MSPSAGFGQLNTGGGHQRAGIHNFELVISKPNDLLLAKELEFPADMNIGKPKRLPDMCLAQRQIDDFTGDVREPAVQPNIKFEQQVRNTLARIPKTEICEVIVRPRLIGGGLVVKQNGEAWVGADEAMQF
jgi:hypothetical protein